jgi:murein DD-endopeptidase MepM/ murein hydrolase activator NlpD
MAVASVIAVVCSWAGAAQLSARAPALAGAWLAQAADGLTALPAGKVSSKPQIVRAAVADRPGAGYRNPLRGVKGLTPERIDEGVDFAGMGPVYALGDAIVTSAAGTNYGWPGGGWITYRLTSGPGVGLVVYVAEDITPAVVAGQRVSSYTVLGTMFDGGDGIETGWAQPVRRIAAPASRRHRRARSVPDQGGGQLRRVAPVAGGARRAQPRPIP